MSSSVTSISSTSHVSSTPASGKPYHTAPDDLGLAQSRKLVLRELLEQVPEVELEWFKDYALPPLHSAIEFDEVLERLTTPGEHLAVNSDGYWSCWENYPVSALKKKENPTFGPIAQLASRICAAAEMPAGVKPTVRFVCLPDKTYTPTMRHNTSKPDGAAILAHAPFKKGIKWFDVAAPGEFKHKSNDDLAQDNRTKILWSLAYIMREDPRRRFVIGYTIEDVSMRLWFASRSDIFVSKPFDFMKNHRYTAYFFLSLSYATRTQLGWDPNIKLSTARNQDPNIKLSTVRNHSPHADFDITVRDEKGVERTFRTKKLLSNLGAEAVRGRGTRVWLVYEVEGGRPVWKEKDGRKVQLYYVLKDCWIDDDRMTEGHIMDAVYSQEGVSDPRVVDRLKRYLLNTETHGRVYVDDSEDHTRNVMLKGQSVPNLHDTIHVTMETGTRVQVASNLAVQGSIAPEAAGPEASPRYSGKVHYRIVYKEVGKTLRTVGSMSKVFDHLAQATRGIFALYSRGWIHRDISVGNVLIVKGQARLSDLEYAKPIVDNQQPHGIRTGTIFFMSTEVESHKYLHRKAPVRELDIVDDSFLDDPEDQAQQEDASETSPPSSPLTDPPSSPLPSIVSHSPPKTPPTRSVLSPPRTPPNPHSQPKTSPDNTSPEVLFRHNGLHDAESVYWLALYLLLVCILLKPDRNPNSQDVSDQYHAYQKAQRRLAALVFCNQSFRRDTLSTDYFLLGEIHDLHPRVRFVIERLDEVRKQIVNAYEEAERHLDREPYTPDLSQVRRLLGTIATAFSNISTALQTDDVMIDTRYGRPHKASGQLKEVVRQAAKASRRAESPPAGADAPGSKRQRVAGQTVAAASSSASGSGAPAPGPSNSQSSTAGPSGAGPSSTAAALQADNMKTPTKPRRSQRTAKGAK